MDLLFYFQVSNSQLKGFPLYCGVCVVTSLHSILRDVHVIAFIFCIHVFFIGNIRVMHGSDQFEYQRALVHSCRSVSLFRRRLRWSGMWFLNGNIKNRRIIMGRLEAESAKWENEPLLTSTHNSVNASDDFHDGTSKEEPTAGFWACVRVDMYTMVLQFSNAPMGMPLGHFWKSKIIMIEQSIKSVFSVYFLRSVPMTRSAHSCLISLCHVTLVTRYFVWRG